MTGGNGHSEDWPVPPPEAPASRLDRPPTARWGWQLVLPSTLITLAGIEGLIRGLWTNGPAALAPVDSQVIFTLHDLPDHATVAPGRYYGFYTHFEVNDQGYRGPIPTPERRPQVAVVGDSFVFGVGVRDDQTLPAAIQATLDTTGETAGVINAGVPAFALADDVRRARRVVQDRHPEVVVLVLIGNDLEQLDASPDGLVPPLVPTGPSMPPRLSRLGRLSEWLVPPPQPPDGLQPSVAARFWLANHWRTYLFVAFRLRGDAQPSEPPDALPMVLAGTHQADQRLWQPLEQQLTTFRALVTSSGGRPVRRPAFGPARAVRRDGARGPAGRPGSAG